MELGTGDEAVSIRTKQSQRFNWCTYDVDVNNLMSRKDEVALRTRVVMICGVVDEEGGKGCRASK